MRWLQSGLRRDICVIVAGLDDPTGQQAKAALERHYDDRVQPKTFHGALEALVSDGFLTRRQDGLADRYALTDAGAERLCAHHEWVASNLGGRHDADARGADSHGSDGKENR
ncbi:PadR family transcriptional regulator [Salinigranum halophilum]|jgi:DNA-binding PadR family transcriptional regulator|uniref:PadR family transcriptional regulator n=1 Tax=Salinigranum halophilum TaxID=2565931 RepID=UPI00191C67A8|nr:PadR family transcriptional regulator [Salinigranum halophilum]